MAKAKTQVATIGPTPSLLVRLGSKYHVDSDKMLATLKATAFKAEREVTNEQMMALCVVADQFGLNPFTKEIYAFPDKKGGIVPVVGVDGWIRIINSHPEFNGMTFSESTEIVESNKHKACPEWIECIIHRKDRSHAVVIREYLDECYRDNSGPWNSHTKRMLRHKAMIQCGRVAMGFVGIYDPDEAERIIEAEVAQRGRKPQTSAPLTIEQKAEPTSEHLVQIRNLLDEFEMSAQQLCEHFGFSGVPAIPAERAMEVCEWIATQDPTNVRA